MQEGDQDVTGAEGIGQPTGQPTGHPAVDAVLASLEGLDSRPVHEHVDVFERAHESLRRALDDDASSASGPGQG